MNQTSEKIKKTSFGAYMHWCPGCHSVHLLYVDKENANGDKWTYREDSRGPTFSPENTIVRQVYVEVKPPVGKMKHTPAYEWKTTCSYTIKNGVISFAADSEHDMAGSSIELPPLPNYR